MEIIIGQNVRGDNFWDRKKELKEIWNSINKGSHILLNAPRRVGKTSIMYKIQDSPQDKYIVLYVDVESADNKNEFWHKVVNKLFEEDFTNTIKIRAKNLFEKIKKRKITKLSLNGIEFEDGEKVNYYQALQGLISDIDKDIKLIIMIDEFAQAVENIIKNDNEKNAISLLQEHRELRQDSNFSSKVLFIYAGSIGLEGVVSTINSSKYINDLHTIKIQPLEYDDSINFIKKLSCEIQANISDEIIKYILDKVEWLIPFYIQLIIDSIKYETTINENTIDKAINDVVKNRNYFESWESKIRTNFKSDELKWTKDILNKISIDGNINILDIQNLSDKYKLNDGYKDILRTLIYDGYINNNEDIKTYRFTSPILKLWWFTNVAN